MQVKDKDLREMDEATREHKLKELVKAAQGFGDESIKKLDAEITEYEIKYGLSSETLRERVSEGRIQETWDICQWLLLLRQFDTLVGERAAKLIGL